MTSMTSNMASGINTHETQLLVLVHELAYGVNANKQTDMAILDFSKAFDKVSHKLQWYGADPLTHAWIADFLRNRTQAVVLEGETSTSVPVTSGVSQGTAVFCLISEKSPQICHLAASLCVHHVTQRRPISGEKTRTMK